LGQPLGQSARRLAEQDGQALFGLGAAGFEAGNLRLGLFQIGAGLLHIQRAGQAGLRPPLGQLQGFRLRSSVSPGDVQRRLGSAQFHVVDRGLGGQRHLDIAQAGFAGFQIGLGGFHAAPETAEYVQFPTGVKPGAEPVGRPAAAGFAAGLHPLSRRRAGNRRKQLRPGQRAPGASLAQFRLGGAEVETGLQGLFDQPGQGRIVELPPPVRQVRRRGGRDGNSCRRRAAPGRRRRPFGRGIVRADRRATGQQNCR